MSNKINKKDNTNFFKETLKSIKDFDKYEDFALELPKNAFKYFIKLILIFAIIVSIFYTYKIIGNMSNIYSMLKEKLPDFSYEEGILKIGSEEPIVLEDYKDTAGKIVIDTNANEEDIKRYEDDKEIAFLFLSDRCITSINTTSGQVSYKYSDVAINYNLTEFNKQDVINYIEENSIVIFYVTVYFIMFIYVFIVYFISILIDVIILSILAYLVSRISKIKLKYAPSFNIAVHSITLPVLLNLAYIIVNLLTGFNIKYFQLMYSTISYIYVIVAVLMIKTDFINRQVELMKIAQEQEKIKKEMQEKEEEKKEKKEEKKTNKPKEKKNKNDKEGLEADAPTCQEIQNDR